MTRDNTYLKRPTGYDAELRSVFGPIFERIAEGTESVRQTGCSRMSRCAG